MRFWPTVPRVPKAVVLTTMLALAVTLPANAQDTGWSYFGADRAFTRYAAVDQVDANNVDRLEVVWRRPGVDATVLAQWEELSYSSYLRSTPVLVCLLYTSPSPRDATLSRMPSSA